MINQLNLFKEGLRSKGKQRRWKGKGIDPVRRKVTDMQKLAERRANKKNIRFELTAEDIENVWPEDNYCPALRIPLKIKPKRKNDPNYLKTTSNSPTLDRIIPELGYIPGNIVVVSMKANMIMSSARPSEVIKVGKWFDEKYYEVKDKLNV
jgi:hypothetical protein